MAIKFIYRLFLFLIILMLILWGLNYFTKTFIYSQSIFNQAENQLEQYNDTIKYLILGDSHLKNGINPLIFKNSFNYSSPDENYVQTYYKLKSLLEKGEKFPENVILIANPSTFCSLKLKRFRFDSYWVRYIDYPEVAKNLKRSDFLLKWFSGEYLSFAGAGSHIIQFFLIKHFSDYSSELYLGYRPKYKDFSKRTDEQISRNVERKSLFYRFTPGYFDKHLVDYFEKTLDMCNKKNITVFLIRVPVTKNFYQKIDDELFSIDDLYAKLEMVTSKYPNIIHLDYLTLFFDHPEFFWSPDHINDRGATAFSKMLNEQLN